MNTKISKILSVLATVAVVASSFVWAIPVAASTPGDGTFTIQDIPGSGTAGKNVILPGSNIIDIAVGSDGKTIYVADNLAGNWLFKSTDGGQSFDLIMNNYVTGALGGAPVAISVAPDDVNTVAVADATGKVIKSGDGGATWSYLSTPTLTGGALVTDLAVGPARSGTLFGREYVVSIANPAAGSVVGGDVQIIGASSLFTTLGSLPTDPGLTNQITGKFDFTSVMVSPGYTGDRTILAVGTNVAGSTALFYFATNAVAEAAKVLYNVPAPVGTAAVGIQLAPSGATKDYDSTALVASSIICSDIAVPTNFDPSTRATGRAYVSFVSVAPNADNDVYRVDDNIKAFSATIPFSVAYSGTVDAGTLFVGPYMSPDIKSYKSPTSSSPDVTTSNTYKGASPVTGTPIKVIVELASDFSASNTIFTGCSGAESGFSVSKDGGVSFNQEALIDCGVVAGTDSAAGTIQGLAFTGDGKSAFLNTKDGNNYINLWKSDLPFSPTSWQRVLAVPLSNAANSGSVKLNGAWATTPAFYVAETGSAAGSNSGQMWTSQDGGVTIAKRSNQPAMLKTYSIRDAQTVYFADQSGNLWKSTNAGFGWGTSVPGGVGAVSIVSLPKANQVILSGVGSNAVTISNDDGATFTTLGSGLPNGAAWYITTDSAYATNNYLYAIDIGNPPTTDGLYRIKTDSTSNIWEGVGTYFPPTTRQTIVSLRSGIMYITAFSSAVGVARSLYPTDLVGNQGWRLIKSGLPAYSLTGTAAPSFTSVAATAGGSNIYVRDSKYIYSFNDSLATTKPTLTAPEDNYANAVNPSNGNGYSVDFKIKPMGIAAGQVSGIDIEIADKNNGFSGSPTWTNIPIAPNNPVINSDNPPASIPVGTAVAVVNNKFTFQPNKTYIWRVRASHIGSTATGAGQDIDGTWSDSRTINVQAGSNVSQTYAGPQLLGPQGGAQGLDPANVGFSWAPVSGATEYQVIIATDAALTKTVAGTPASVTIPAFQATGLADSTTYFWAVMATKPTASVQTVGTFTTKPKAVVQPTGTANQPPQTIFVPNNGPVETPAYIWAVIAIGAILVIAVIILIVRTRRVP